MILKGSARGPGSGKRARRGAIGLATALCVLLSGTVFAARRIGDPQIGYTPLVTIRGQVARLPDPQLPPDTRLAPRDFTLDSDTTNALSATAQSKADAQLALAQLSQNYRPDPAIWRIGDRDTTIYLFGTIHVLPPGFQWRSPAIDRIVTAADTLIVESVDDDSGMESLMPAANGGAPLPPLIQRVTPDHRAALERFTATLDPNAAAALDGLPTWIAAVAIGFVRDFRAGEIPGPGADDWLEGYFRARGKPVVAIEDGQKVLANVSAIPAAEQQAMLNAALDAPRRSRADLRAATHAWAKGEVGPESALSMDLAGTSGSGALAGPLISDRNRAWADNLATRLGTPGTMLFAAGAGHFIGNESVLALLRQRGIKVTRLR